MKKLGIFIIILSLLVSTAHAGWGDTWAFGPWRSGEKLVDPDEDSIPFWDDSAGVMAWGGGASSAFSFYYVADDGGIGIGPALERIIFDVDGDIQVLGANLGINVEPSSKLHVLGNIEMDSGTLIYDVNNITADLVTFETFGAHIINSSGAGVTGTLAAGDRIGESVKFVCKVAGNNIDITVANHVTSDPEVIRLDTAKEWVELVWDGTDWVEVDGNGQTYP